MSLLLTFAAHYVDDFFSVEQALFAESSFAAFQAFHLMLGFRMKEAKSKPPSKTHTLLGIDWTLDDEYVRAELGPTRIARLVSTIPGFLDSDVMSSAECSSLTGRLCFSCTWVFGNVGRSFLQPLYFRQHHGHPGHSRLTPRVRQALQQIQRLLGQVQPVRFPVQLDARRCLVAHLYADAFITLHGVRRSARRWLSEEPPLRELQASTNGFGAMFAIPGRNPVAFRGEVPTFVLADLASSRAYIFWLEALAQVLSLLTVSQMVQNHVMCWIDNTSAEHALNKGYSKDLGLSAVIGSFWTWVASRSMSVSFHRVPSSENLSDGVLRGDLSEVRAVQGQFATVQFREAGASFRRSPQSRTSTRTSSSSCSPAWAPSWFSTRQRVASRLVDGGLFVRASCEACFAARERIELSSSCSPPTGREEWKKSASATFVFV